jgi:glycerol uptake facilitator-like aquaporin
MSFHAVLYCTELYSTVSIAQIVGSIIGAYTVKSAISTDIVNSSGLGGCYLGPLSTLSGFVFECFFTLVVLFVAFGIALDEDQRQVFGPIFGM